MTTAFTSKSFAEPAQARANLDLLRERLPFSLFDLLPTVLAQVPDPDGALNRLERFTRQCKRRVVQALCRRPAWLHYLLALFSHSRYLSETLIQQPELILWLSREKQLERLKTPEELLEEYARFEVTALDLEPSRALARFKRHQYLRITLKDILNISTLVETTLELSTLADVLLEKALHMAHAELSRRYGPPMTRDAQGRLVPARFAVVSLGKLGGRELNYNSDVDLLFLFDGEGMTGARDAERSLDNSEYFLRLAQRLLQIIAGVTPEGAVFRVDTRLRPGGGEGDLALSLPAALDYYRRRAREWELQMLLKARRSAGDPALVREFLAGIEPPLYRGPLHFAAVESVLRAREQFDRKLDAAGHERVNVKLAAGGIRDIEFLVQCLQRLYGREDPWVRVPGTLLGLQKLFDKGYLSSRDHHRLASAYEFLRLVEHRLQLELGQQVHTLPEEPRARQLLARRCGLQTHRELESRLEENLQSVRAIYERVLAGTSSVPQEEDSWLRGPESITAQGSAFVAETLQRLAACQPSDVEPLRPEAVPERARLPLRRFLAAATSSSEAFEEVARAAAALPAALEVFRLSRPLGEFLIREPGRLAYLLSAGGQGGRSESQPPLPLQAGSPAILSPALAAAVESSRSFSERMAGLRRYYSEAVFRWGARSLLSSWPVEEALRDFTALTEEILRAGLLVASAEQSVSNRTGFFVLALGRLGTAEMDLGSDADLVFVAADVEAQARWRPVAEKLIHVVSGYTREGTLFPIDVRLRPRGGEGELVQTDAGILDYFAQSAEVWEAVTYLKARPVVGDRALGEEWCVRMRRALAARFADWEEVRRGLRTMRARLETEGAKGAQGEQHLKAGAGGFYDLDFLFSGLALRAGARSLADCSLARQAEVVAGEELSADDRRLLAAAARLLRAVEHATRLVTGQSTSLLPAGAARAAIAELTGRWLGEPLRAEDLARQLGDMRARVRALFERVFG